MEENILKKTWPALQVILHPYGRRMRSQAAEEILEGGISWLQYRNKEEVPYAEKLSEARFIQEKCARYKAIYIVNDSPVLALESQAHGVHLGKADICPTEARRILGQEAIIGGTANTMEDIRRLHDQGVDYIGLGPFRFTTTKEKLSPVLGFHGYRILCEQCMKENIKLPIHAIGGIKREDIPELMQCAIHGIAVSSLILNHRDPKEFSRLILADIKKYTSDK